MVTVAKGESRVRAGGFGTQSSRTDRRVVVDVVLRDQVVLDGDFGQEMPVNGAQGRDTRVEGFAYAFQPGDLIVELRSQAVTDFGVGDGLDGPVPRARLTASDGKTQGLAAEENYSRGPRLPSEALIEAQQGSDLRGALVTSAADLRERVGTGPTAAGHFVLGQVELGHAHFDEVDESLDALTGNCHRPHPTGRNAANRLTVSGGRYAPRSSEGHHA